MTDEEKHTNGQAGQHFVQIQEQNQTPASGVTTPEQKSPPPPAVKTPEQGVYFVNQTPYRIGIQKNGSDEIGRVIAPFGSIKKSEDDQLDYTAWKNWNLIEEQKEEARSSPFEKYNFGFFMVLFYGVIAGLIVKRIMLKSVEGTPEFWSPTGFVFHYWKIFFGLLLIAYLIGILVIKKGPRSIWTWGLHSMNMFFTMLISFGLPGLAIYYFGGIRPLPPDTIDPHLLGRILQFLLIGTFASLPALLFHLFDRQHLFSVLEKFFRSILLFDPNLMNMREAQSIYGTRVKEVFGTIPEGMESGGSGISLLKSKRFIIPLTTLIITIGWLLCLSPVGKMPNDATLGEYFVPKTTPINFAFLGAYVFAVGLLFRQYVRADLKPKAYAHISVRTISSIAFVWVLSTLPFLRDPVSAASGQGTAAEMEYSSVLLSFSFIVGVFPMKGFSLIQEFFTSRKLLKTGIPSLEERFPLTLLDGMNIYYRARLLEEGIENLENLAHSDFVDLMLQTRIPLPTLVDWIDQSILYLHLSRCPLVSEIEEPVETDSQSPDQRTAEISPSGAMLSDIEKLRRFGIRTATDLMRAYDRAGNKNEFLEILEEDGHQPGLRRLEVLLHAISDDEWICHLKKYRDVERYDQKILRFKDFEDKYLHVNVGERKMRTPATAPEVPLDS